MKKLITILVLMFVAMRASAASPIGTGGKVYKWGATVEGQSALASWTNMTQVSGNSYWMVGLRSDGKIASFGQKAAVNGTHPTNGTYTYVTAGWSHGIAITNGGSLVEWGVPYTTHTIGVDWITPSTGTYTKVAAGDNHSAALRSDGVVITWGGRVSNTSKSGVYSNAMDIACTWYATAIVHSNGTVTTFGEASRPGSYIAVPAAATNVVAIEASRFNFVARRADGTMVAWGYTDTSGYTTPQANSYNCNGYMSGDSHIVQLNSDGSVSAWGLNASGQTNVPVGLVSAVAVGAQYNYSWAIQDNESGEPPSSSTVRYVRKDGSDSNTGLTDSAAGALLTLSAALGDAAPGMTIYLGPGDWAETNTTQIAGTSASRIVIDGRNQASTHKLTIAHPYYTLRNLTIGGIQGPTFNILLKLSGGAHYTTVDGCTFDPAGQTNIYGIYHELGSGRPFDDADASFCLVTNSTFTRFTGTNAPVLAWIAGVSNVYTHNTFTNNSSCDIFRVWGRTNFISDNLVIDCRGEGGHPDLFQNVSLNGQGSRGHIIERNVFKDAPGFSMGVLEMDGTVDVIDWTFRNNVFENIGIKFESSIPQTKLYHNTFARCAWFGETHAVFLANDSDGGGATNSVVQGNVFIDCGETNTLSNGWYAFSTNLLGTADYNYVAKGPSFSAVNSGSVPIGATHDNNKFYELHGINGGDPRMVNLSSSNFRLQSDSKLINAGAALAGIANDVDGGARDGTPDIGAYEYVGAPLVWLRFEDDFSDGQLDDSSGNNAHALRYGWGTTGTNWPSAVSPGAPLNLTAARFLPYYESRPYVAFPTYNDGQYAAITNVPAGLLAATNFTAILWARFDDNPAGYTTDESGDNQSTFLNVGWDSVGCWMFGRYYSGTYGEPKFLIVTNAGDLSASYQLPFPQIGQFTNDVWRNYAVTVDCSAPNAPVVKLYTNGVLYATHTLAATIPYLTIADPPGDHPEWIGLSCWTHNTTPELGVNKRPNIGWMHGAMDDVRLYNRVLGPAEIASIANMGSYTPSQFACRIQGGTLRGGSIR